MFYFHLWILVECVLPIRRCCILKIDNNFSISSDIVLELVVILWQCGHNERASAICQGLLEFNMNCPEVLKETTAAERLEFLEAFWDGSLPRVGEENAKGWRHWVDTKGDDTQFGQMYTRGK